MNLRYKSLAHYRIKVVRPIQSFPKWARYLVLDKVRRLELPSSTLCMSLALVPPTHPTRLNGIRKTFYSSLFKMGSTPLRGLESTYWDGHPKNVRRLASTICYAAISLYLLIIRWGSCVNHLGLCISRQKGKKSGGIGIRLSSFHF